MIDTEGRQLHIRAYAPMHLRRWDSLRGFRFSWRMAFNPINWIRAACCKGNWALRWKWFGDCNHRCYCPVGQIFDGRVCIAGFGLNWWYSNYTGPIPCWCDQAWPFDSDGEQ